MGRGMGDELIRLQAEKIYHDYYWVNEDIRKRGEGLSAYWHRKGLGYLNQYLMEKAIFCFRRGIRMDPRNWKLRYDLAKVYRDQGLVDQYVQELGVILDLDLLGRERSEIGDEMRFSRRAMKGLMSYREGIDQYNEMRAGGRG